VLNPAPVDVDLDDRNARLDAVRAAWRDVLGIEDLADDTTFFDAGGDSIRLVVLVERLNEATGCALRTIDLFRAGTVRGHAELLTGPERLERPEPVRPGRSAHDRLIEAARLRAAGATRRGH
jgi:aryl carrier-like protein